MEENLKVLNENLLFEKNQVKQSESLEKDESRLRNITSSDNQKLDLKENEILDNKDLVNFYINLSTKKNSNEKIFNNQIKNSKKDNFYNYTQNDKIVLNENNNKANLDYTNKKNIKKNNKLNKNANEYKNINNNYPYENFFNEEEINNENTRNSVLKFNGLYNNELRYLFEKTIMKKDHYSNYKRKKFSLSIMLFYIIIYFFCCLALLIANCQDPDIIELKYNVPFHMLDFWGSFGFALIEAAILVIADMVTIGSMRYFIVAVNIGTTLIAAILFSFNPEFWEVPCHWIEFSAQIFITLSDILFIFHQFKKTENVLYKYRYYELGLVLFFACSAVTKLLVYGDVISLGIDGEQAAHFFEYCGEMVNALFAFVFTFVMYKECNDNLNSIFSFDEDLKE